MAPPCISDDPHNDDQQQHSQNKGNSGQPSCERPWCKLEGQRERKNGNQASRELPSEKCCYPVQTSSKPEIRGLGYLEHNKRPDINPGPKNQQNIGELPFAHMIRPCKRMTHLRHTLQFIAQETCLAKFSDRKQGCLRSVHYSCTSSVSQ